MEPTRINNSPGSHRGAYNTNYNEGYYPNMPPHSNMPPRKKGNHSAVIIGMIAGILLCGVVFLIVYLVNKNNELREQIEAVEIHPDKAGDEEGVATMTASSGVLKSGRNSMTGSFNYAGADYSFSLSFNYNPATGQTSGGKYEATGYAGETKVSVAVSNNGRNIVVSGKSTYIDISAPSGSKLYTGTMTRGNHNGTCRVKLN